MLYQNDKFTSGTERFFTLEELYLDGENLIFYKAKRTPTAISLTHGILMRYYKKQWKFNFGDESFLCFILDRIVVKSIIEMPIVQKGKIKGELKTILSPKEPLKKIFSKKFNILEEYQNYRNIILFHEAGALLWFRQNGFYADILVGCFNKQQLDKIVNSNLSVVWE